MTAPAIQPIETADGFFVTVILDGHELKPHGPFRDIDAAEAVAARFAGICRVLHRSAAIGVVPAAAKCAGEVR
jgi:hypothetical protein